MDRPAIDTAEKAAEKFAFIRNEMREHFACLTLDSANHLIACRVISIGTLTASLVHPREVFVNAILDHAAGIIVGHNHPSGDLQPSQSDLNITRQLRSAGKLLGIKLIDHIIITPQGFNSLD
jgi:DNA repair protein RadC